MIKPILPLLFVFIALLASIHSNNIFTTIKQSCKNDKQCLQVGEQLVSNSFKLKTGCNETERCAFLVAVCYKTCDCEIEKRDCFIPCAACLGWLYTGCCECILPIEHCKPNATLKIQSWSNIESVIRK